MQASAILALSTLLQGCSGQAPSPPAPPQLQVVHVAILPGLSSASTAPSCLVPWVDSARTLTLVSPGSVPSPTTRPASSARVGCVPHHILSDFCGLWHLGDHRSDDKDLF